MENAPPVVTSVDNPAPDELSAKALSLLGAHASNALYANVAQASFGAAGGIDMDDGLLDV